MDYTTGAAPDRCPRCAALVRPGTQWCTLCYADLRPAPPARPTPAPPPAAAVPAAQAPAAASSEIFDPLTAPLALLERGALAPAPAQATTEGTERSAPPPQASWPCASCGAAVPLDEPNCTSCGAGFLEGMPVDPVLGRLAGGTSAGVSNQTKLLIMVGGSLGLLVLILGVMYIAGTVF